MSADGWIKKGRLRKCSSED
ncbi:hypothetical protein Bhyg_09592 [Pseudolycoriella hygida]|uniref:Uncharacterized protein n=1 Tax=Pseudolycoriella hygida TaxID=35572 RepID=A0A9Q0S5F7_9DIPT|nr:hypothetical protein Bhyg_09592 [Pseudolycoriella hygida]